MSNSIFFAKLGLQFQRNEQGNVTITVSTQERGGDQEIVLDEESWCSAIAAMSKRGGTAETFQAAKRFQESN